jgi:hypothetical protein
MKPFYLRALFALLFTAVFAGNAATSAQNQSHTGDHNMDDVEFTFIEMNCPHLKHFQEELMDEFRKNPGLGYNREALAASLIKNDTSDIKKFLSCFDAYEEGKEPVSSTGEELEFINIATPLYIAVDKNRPDFDLITHLQIYVTFKDNKPHAAHIMANF